MGQCFKSLQTVVSTAVDPTSAINESGSANMQMVDKSNMKSGKWKADVSMQDLMAWWREI